VTGGRRSTFRLVALNAILLLVTVLVFSAALEIALRIIFARSLDFSMEMWKYAVELKRPVANPELSFVHAPNRSAFLMGVPVSINSHGLRDHEYAEAKPTGTYRIVMLGDSTCFGWGVRLDETVAKMLERDLNAASLPPYRHFEVLNAGVGNYDTVQEVAHYENYDRAFHPDLVILEYFINDAEPVPSERHPWLLGRSYLVAFTVSRWDTLLQFAGVRPRWDAYYAGLYNDGRPGFQAAKQALAKLDALTRRDGANLVVAILPELHRINDGYPFAQEQQKIKDVLSAEHVPVIDLIEGLRGHGPESSLWVTREDPHPNEKANALITAQILGWIKDRLR